MTDNGDGTGTLNVAAAAGTALIGKVGIDQTTDGTTNAVHLTAGTNLAGMFGIDQVSANANEVVVKSTIAGCDSPQSGQTIVTAAGTQEAIGGNVDVRNLIVIADPDNSGNIYVGPSTVDSSTGIKLPAGGILPCGNVNLSEIYIDSDVSGEGISYYYTT